MVNRDMDNIKNTIKDNIGKTLHGAAFAGGCIKADLHIHTHFSDGEDSPEQVISYAKSAGVQLVSVTDHDSVDGVRRAKAAAESLGLEFISGIELSCKSVGEVHILGYGMDIDNAAFVSELERLKALRLSRIRQTLQKLNALGIAIGYEEIKCGDSGLCGRVHVAKALVQKGVCGSVGEAFTRYLGYGRPAYIFSERLSVGQAIEIIRVAGGKSVLAHPYQIDCPPHQLFPLVKSYRDMGLNGIESGYYAHTKVDIKRFTAMADKLGLFNTCGSDYHGDIRNSAIKGFELSGRDYDALKQGL